MRTKQMPVAEDLDSHLPEEDFKALSTSSQVRIMAAFVRVAVHILSVHGTWLVVVVVAEGLLAEQFKMPGIWHACSDVACTTRVGYCIEWLGYDV